jgi:hypothetical protein
MNLGSIEGEELFDKLCDTQIVKMDSPSVTVVHVDVYVDGVKLCL